MRALLSTIGSRGDVQPLVALALELKKMDHDVRLCVPPDFQHWLHDLGLDVVTIGPEVRKASVSMPATPPTPEQRRQLVAGTVATQFDTLSAAARDCDIVLAATALQVAARSVAEALSLPYAFAAYSPVVLPSPHHAPPPLPIPGMAPPPPDADNASLWARDAERFNDTFGEAVNAHRASRGLPALEHVRDHMLSDSPWLAADATLAPWPTPSDRVVQTGAWIWEDQRPLPEPAERFLDAGAAPVYFGFGSTRTPADIGRLWLDAARSQGRRAVVSRGWAGLAFDDASADVLAVDDVNLLKLLPRVALVVHHGGAGTTTAAAISGVPQVVTPQMYDQFYWAQQVQRLGVGRALPTGTVTADSLATAIGQATEPAVTTRAAALAPQVRRDGARVAAERLAALAR